MFLTAGTLGAVLLACALQVFGQLQSAPSPQSSAGHGALLRIDGPIGPATSAYLEHAGRQAVEEGASVLVLQIDTPGGLDSATRDIVRWILASPIPVIGYVSPEGARAASAGTYIMYATHVAVMAPATHLGSATPVPISGPAPSLPKPGIGGKDSDETADDGSGSAGGPEPDAMQKKVINDAVAYIRGLAERRGRNVEWAELAVREGANLTASDALEKNVIDLVAPTLQDLLAEISGREVETSAGKRVLVTAGLTVREIEPDWRMKLLAALASPTIAYILLLAGMYGLLLEGYNPGAMLPGVVGAICLLLGLFALQMLPVNYVGLALMILGIALLIGEMMVPSFGVLGFGGIAAFVLGSVMLMDSDVPGYAVNVGVIGGIAAFASVLMGLTIYMAVRSHKKPVVTGEVRQVGQIVQISSFESGKGQARLGGEIWNVRCSSSLSPGDRARVTEVQGLTLMVEPIE